jgi:hypothetical protein
VVQGVGSEFKSQYRKKKKKREKSYNLLEVSDFGQIYVYEGLELEVKEF